MHWRGWFAEHVLGQKPRIWQTKTAQTTIVSIHMFQEFALGEVLLGPAMVIRNHSTKERCMMMQYFLVCCHAGHLLRVHYALQTEAKRKNVLCAKIIDSSARYKMKSYEGQQEALHDDAIFLGLSCGSLYWWYTCCYKLTANKVWCAKIIEHIAC